MATCAHLIKHGYKFDGTLAHEMEVNSVHDNNNQKRQKVYKYYGFAMAVLIWEVGHITEELDLGLTKQQH